MLNKFNYYLFIVPVLVVFPCKSSGIHQSSQLFEEFISAAQAGDSESQFQLGVIYDRGEGVDQDYRQAVEWYTKAASSGHADAQFHLGTMYDRGEGVDQNYQQAFYWYQKAAKQGILRAQFNLGVMY